MIRSVTGSVNKDKVRNVLMHEHIQCVSNDMLFTFGKKWLDEERMEAYAIQTLKRLKEELQVDVFVDGTPCDLGRNVRLLKNVSEATGMEIIASTGLYYYPSALTCKRSAEDLAKLFLEECAVGMEDTGIKPGILKCAADAQGMTEDVKKRLEALGIVQRETGLPLYAHCSHDDNLAMEMIDLFLKQGAAADKIIMGHASRRMDPDYLESVLKRNVYICIDQSWEGDEDRDAAAVYELCQRGCGKQILLSHDRPLYNDFETPDKTGIDMPVQEHMDRFAFIPHILIPAFKKAGCTEQECAEFTRENALRVLEL